MNGNGDGPLLEVQDLKKYYPLRGGIFGGKVGEVRAVDIAGSGRELKVRSGASYEELWLDGDDLLLWGRARLRRMPLPSGAELGSGLRTVWFDRGDNRPADGHGGDFATGNYKGQCADHEHVVGVAYRSWIWSPGKEPDALLCRRQRNV